MRRTSKFLESIQSVESVLEERHLPSEVFWSTEINAINAILQDGFITPSPALSADDTDTSKYFLSVSRVKINSYRNTYNGVTVVMDGRLLESRYKTDPINYWSPRGGKSAHTDEKGELLPNIRKMGNEAEERIHINETKIPVEGVVKEIHCMWNDEWNEKHGSFFPLHNAQKYGIEVYIYLDRKYFKHLRKSKAKKLDEMELNYEGRSKNAEDRDLLELESILDYVDGGMKDPKHFLSRYDWDRRGMVSHINNTIHSARRKKGMGMRYLFERLFKLYEKYGTKDWDAIISKIKGEND